MNTFSILLQKIRERPGIYLGEKSLTKLVQYRHGYEMREHLEYWEKHTGRSFSEHFHEAINFMIPESEQFPIHEFSEFVGIHYNCSIGAMSGEHLISINSNSEEEAFDKYLELYDEFCAIKGITTPTLPTNK